MQSCHHLVATQWWRVGFHLTRSYFWGRAYITSILRNHTRAYFQVRSYFQGNCIFSKEPVVLLVFHLESQCHIQAIAQELYYNIVLVKGEELSQLTEQSKMLLFPDCCSPIQKALLLGRPLTKSWWTRCPPRHSSLSFPPEVVETFLAAIISKECTSGGGKQLFSPLKKKG